GGFAGLNIALVAIWLGLSVLIGRDYKRLVQSGQPPCLIGERPPASARPAT
ncbi:MAG: hypothetical protein GWN99_11530, partial [Gemmatimonadetes bacterium]|nr:hypothetical protein [Gemmatimonadota bacterium]NIT67410.1 hypothetical protein [Gemmatimonadota bacterium]NIU52840.1 hypothetical protein [Gemmatimonadota bacterium]NIV24137.1 hypothetical protein [Gemmatimonadota bacterium]NIW36590.1 hypothetical protein [Gemmatimonadota bacterium]